MTFALDVCGDVVIVSGNLDIATAPALREALLTVIADRNVSVIVDLDGVDFIDSTGLGVLASATSRVRRQGGDLVIICSRPRILFLFRMTGLQSVFTVQDALDGHRDDPAAAEP